MSYNLDELPRFAKTAGRISILSAVVGVCVFMFALMVDVGNQELQRVSAQTATTSLTVLNTPPTFVVQPFEIGGSSTSTPTNSGEEIQWTAVGSDANGADYYLLICSTNASPTPQIGAAPTCGGGVQWGVSTATPSDTVALVSTTTVELADDPGTQFSESNDWFAWVCDGDLVQPECTTIATQGTTTDDTAPPFHMNSRPVLTDFYNDGPVDPGATLNFFSTSTDPDIVDASDTLTLVVCQQAIDYSTTTNSCVANSLGSSTFNGIINATSSYAVSSPVRDGTYPAVGFLVDEHGHEASAPIVGSFDINNVAPTILGANINLNGGADIALTVPGDQTPGFSLDFTASDGNSCINSSGATSSEIVGFEVSVYRSGIGTTSCNSGTPDYDPNNCYTSGVATSTWNLTCTASTTSCTGITDDTQEFNCTFPLWFVADATDNGSVASPFEAENWLAAVAPSDDNFATSSLVASNIGVEVLQFAALDLATAEIPYGALAPGDGYTLLGGDAGTTTSEIINIGNTGIDQEVRGESMCPNFSVGTPCGGASSSTIDSTYQEFSDTTVAYNTTGLVLSSTTNQELELDVLKSTTTATTTASRGTTYWGIYVPGGADPTPITVAGSYEGLNTFTAVIAEAVDW